MLFLKKLLLKIKNKEHNSLDTFVLFVIVISAILIGIETEPTVFLKYYILLHRIDIIILTIFILEMVIKMIAEGKKPWLYFKDPWNIFDFIIIIVSLLPFIISAGQNDTHAFAAIRIIRLFRIMRALRAFRVLRLVTHLKPLQLIVTTLIKSIPSMMYVLSLLTILFYLYAIIGHYLFGKFDPEHFGDLFSSLLTLFESMLGSWSSFIDPLMHSSEKIMENGKEILKAIDYSYIVPIYFISFYFMGGLIILNLFIGVIVSELLDAKKQQYIEETRESFKDDLSKESFKIVIELENQIEKMNLLFHKLQISLNEDKD